MAYLRLLSSVAHERVVGRPSEVDHVLQSLVGGQWGFGGFWYVAPLSTTASRIVGAQFVSDGTRQPRCVVPEILVDEQRARLCEDAAVPLPPPFADVLKRDPLNGDARLVLELAQETVELAQAGVLSFTRDSVESPMLLPSRSPVGEHVSLAPVVLSRR